MGFFAYPYLVTFDDTMAYGTHHFLTNFIFQCAAREALLFGHLDGQQQWRQELEKIIMLTRDGYSRNMTAVPVGERVVVFMSFEEPTLSSLRLCFRTVNHLGQPVACGYQTIVCVDRGGSGLVELPNAFTRFRDHVAEPLEAPSFQERALKGGRVLDTMFPPELGAVAQRLAEAPFNESYPRILTSADLGFSR